LKKVIFMPMIETIRERVSCRTYRADPIERDKLSQLEAFLAADQEAPFGSRVRFRLLAFDQLNREEIKDCGTYGVIKGARQYIAGAVVKQHRALEDYGYCLEQCVLQASALGLGTCWLGGTFKRSGFASKLALAEDELMPAVTPVGYAADRRSVVDHVFRFSAGSNKRKPWEQLFFERDLTGMKREAAGPYETVLTCVRVGPSASNKQPWRIIRDEARKSFHFYLERTPGYSDAYGEVRLQNVDMGIAMCHFALSARELGLEGCWQVADPGLKAGKMEYIASWSA